MYIPHYSWQILKYLNIVHVYNKFVPQISKKYTIAKYQHNSIVLMVLQKKPFNVESFPRYILHVYKNDNSN